MRILSTIFNFYINSSIHVALAVVSLVLITCFEFEISINLYLVIVVFLGTVTGYNFVKYAKIAGLHHHSLTESLRLIQIFSFFTFACLIYFIFYLHLEVLLTLSVLSVFTLFYAVPLIRNKNLRTIGGIKIFIVALVWAGVTVIVPIIDSLNYIDYNIWITFVQRFGFVFVMTLPFEIRDLKYDHYLLKTIPQRFGIKTTKILGLIILGLICVLEIFKTSLQSEYFIVQLLILILLAIILFKSRAHQSRYFSSFYVEGIPIVWTIILIGLKSLEIT